jgi:ABC-2 type transport system ATP-binding protein
MFSGGQAQRAMIARALMHEPDVLFLDEPSTGLDPAARLFVWDRIRDLRERGVTVLLTTHDMEEAETLADRVGIMDHGHVLALDTPTNLTRSLPGSSTLDVSFTLDPTSSEQLLTDLNAIDGIERAELLGEEAPATNTPGSATRLRLYVTGEASALIAPVATRVAALGGALVDVRVGSPSLEDVFIELTGRALR